MPLRVVSILPPSLSSLFTPNSWIIFFVLFVFFFSAMRPLSMSYSFDLSGKKKKKHFHTWRGFCGFCELHFIHLFMSRKKIERLLLNVVSEIKHSAYLKIAFFSRLKLQWICCLPRIVRGPLHHTHCTPVVRHSCYPQVAVIPTPLDSSEAMMLNSKIDLCLKRKEETSTSCYSSNQFYYIERD